MTAPDLAQIDAAIADLEREIREIGWVINCYRTAQDAARHIDRVRELAAKKARLEEERERLGD